MKLMTRAAALAAALLTFSTASWSTGSPTKETPPPKQTTNVHGTTNVKTSTGPVHSSSAAAVGPVASDSKSAADSKSASDAKAETGPVTVDQGDSHSNYRAWAIGLPPPVSGGNAAVNGCVVAGNSAFAAGWSFISKTDPVTLEARHCTMLLAARDAHERCQFLTSATLTAKVGSELAGVTLTAPDGERNLTAKQCHDLRNPPPPPAPPAAPPAPQPEPPKAPERVSLRADTLFDFDKADLKPAGQRVLAELAGRLKGAEAVRIVGHTDWIGSDDYNDRLSQRRADAVAAFLVLKGTPRSIISTSGRGEREPVADNRTDEGRQLNRRVEVTITGAKP